MAKILKNLLVYLLQAVLAACPVAALAAENPVPGEFIICFDQQRIDAHISRLALGSALRKGALSARSRSIQRDFLHKLGARRIQEFRSGSAYLVALEQSLADLPDELRPYVSSWEPNYRVIPHRLPNDRIFGEGLLYGLHNTGQGILGQAGVSDVDINAAEVWDVTTGSEIVVGVIDTGIDYRHEDLAASMWQNPLEIPGNGWDDDGNGLVDDVFGFDFLDQDSDPFDEDYHGTHVAGIIGAAGNNSFGVTGVNWEARLISLRALDANGGDVATVVRAIEYAVMMKQDFNVPIRVLNMSFGGPGASAFLSQAIASARDAGIVSVASAGNESANNDHTAVFPAGDANVISVAAVDNRGQLASFSNYGKQSVHIGAPGVDIVSSLPRGSGLVSRYGYLSGTSMAAPFVSGVSALIFGLNPNISPDELRALLVNTAKPLSSLAERTISGGMVDAFAAAEALSGRHAVRGHVRDSSNRPIQGVNIDGGSLGHALTDALGFYQFADIGLGSYTLTPVHPEMRMSPESARVIIAGQDAQADFTASRRMQIFGIVRDGRGEPLPGVSLHAPGLATASTDIYGFYEFTHWGSGTFLLTPEKQGFQFEPAQLLIELRDRDVEQGFVGTCEPGFIQDGAFCLLLTLPDAPNRVQASDGSSTQYVDVRWDAVPGALAYSVYRAASPGEMGNSIASGVEAAFYRDFSAEPRTVYYYAVQAVNESGNSELSSSDSGFRRAGSDPGPVPPEEESDFLTSPAYSKYNTFLNQQNFLELLAGGEEKLEIKITVFDENGAATQENLLRLEPGTQFDVDINRMVNRRDAVGVVRLDFDDSAPGALSGRMSSYRPNADGRSFSFVVVRELRNANYGTTYAGGNTFDAQGRGIVMPNWVEIVNLDTRTRRFVHRLIDQAGALLKEQAVIVPPFGERDLEAGHAYGEGVFLNELIPENSDFPYLGAATRYAPNLYAGRGGESYSYSISLPAKPGSSLPEYAPITDLAGKCWTQTNWLEVLNVGSSPAEVQIVFRDAAGAMLSQSTAALNPKAQQHFFASAMLIADGLGSVEVSPRNGAEIISQSAVYYHDCRENALQTAYAVSSRPLRLDSLRGSFNRFLGMQNIFSSIVKSSAGVDSPLSLAWGNSALEQFSLPSTDNPSVSVAELDITPSLPVDSYGVLTLNLPPQVRGLGQVIRLHEVDGSADFAVPISFW